jgi:hypothetical protein
MDSEKNTDQTAAEAFCAAALDLARARMQSAQSQRANADALEKAAKALERDAEAARAMAAELELAREGFKQKAEALRSQAGAEAILAHREASSFSRSAPAVAVQFETFDLAALNLFGTSRSAWRKGDEFSLQAEPSNKHDPNAVKVLLGGKQIAYLAKDDTKKIAKMRSESGWELSGEAYLLDTKNGRWNNGRVSVRMENPLMGWKGYNPCVSFEKNMAAMEREIFADIALAPAPSLKRPTAL